MTLSSIKLTFLKKKTLSNHTKTNKTNSPCCCLPSHSVSPCRGRRYKRLHKPDILPGTTALQSFRPPQSKSWGSSPSLRARFAQSTCKHKQRSCYRYGGINIPKEPWEKSVLVELWEQAAIKQPAKHTSCILLYSYFVKPFINTPHLKTKKKLEAKMENYSYMWQQWVVVWASDREYFVFQMCINGPLCFTLCLCFFLALCVDWLLQMLITRHIYNDTPI